MKAARPHRELPDGELIEAMRRDDARAIEEFLLRFEPFLRERARRAGIRSPRAAELALEVLEDVATHIASGRLRPRGSLAGYLFITFRNRCSTDDRRDRAHERALGRVAECVPDARGAGELAYSEASIRASRGPECDESDLSPVLARLAARLEQEIDESERRMLVWLSHYIPQREIAEWLGLGYAAATQRIWRLRERLRKVAVQYAAELDDRERWELERFFRRVRGGGDDREARGRRGARGTRSHAGDEAGRAREEKDDG